MSSATAELRRRLASALPFRRRLTLAAAAAVAVAIALASAITFVTVRAELRGQIDDSLRETAGDLASDQTIYIAAEVEPPPSGRSRIEVRRRHESPADPLPEVSPAPGVAERLLVAPLPFGGAARYAQLVRADGEVVNAPSAKAELPGVERAARLAREGDGSYFSDVHAAGTHLRVFTRALRNGLSLQVARPVDETDDALRRLGGVLALVTLGGVGLAAGLALFVTRTGLRPVTLLSAAAEEVAQTRDLSRRMEGAASDELGRLARSFNTMLEALEGSMRQQRRLVADASHELRTPLTSLRTNIEVLANGTGMPDADRRALLGDVVGQLEELTLLVGDLVDLARDGEEEERFSEDVRLDTLVEEVIERARKRHPGREFALDAEPTVVRGVPARLDRAVSNLLDNAEKWSPADGRIEVAVRDGEVTVRDHGPGIADEDLPFVFDRFYRAASARGMPGSGLGLAIVRQVAETHGGAVVAERAEDGGARLRLRIPVAS